MEKKFPGKLEWGMLIATAAILAGICRPIPAHSDSAETPKVVPTEVPTPAPVYGPFPLAQRVHCHDVGAYNDRRLNFACGQEKHQ